MLYVAAAFTAFIVGFAMKRGGLCTYAAAVQIVQQRTGERMFAFLGAAACATIIIVPLSWWAPHLVALSFTHSNFTISIWGGLILGLGAYLNKGCMFGTFVQLVGGNSTYVATLIGMSIGVVITYQNFDTYIPPSQNVTHAAQPEPGAYLWLLIASLFALLIVFKVRQKPAIFIMLILGIGGGLLSTTINSWDYASVLTQVTHKIILPQAPGTTNVAIVCALTMIVGGVYAAISEGSFKFQTPGLLSFTASLAGGTLMGAAAIIVPGGNDGMLLKGIPSFAPHAIVGYLFMIVAMLVLIAIFRNKAVD